MRNGNMKKRETKGARARSYAPYIQEEKKMVALVEYPDYIHRGTRKGTHNWQAIAVQLAEEGFSKREPYAIKTQYKKIKKPKT